MEGIPIVYPKNNDEGASDTSTGSTPPDVELITTLEGGFLADEKEPPDRDRDPTPKIAQCMKQYLSLPSSSYSTLMPYQASQVYNILKICFPDEVNVIVDATAHIGGDSILFANTFKNSKIVAVDCDQEAIMCLEHNITTFSDSSRFEVIKANSVRWIEAEKRVADFYYFDPPWGGPRYYSKKEVELYLDGLPICEVINTVFALGLTKKILLKVPRNFAYPALKLAVNGTCKLYYIKKPQKNGSIAYGLVLISDDRRKSWPD